MILKKKKVVNVVDTPNLDPEIQSLVDHFDEFTGYIPEENYFLDYNDEAFVNVMETQDVMIKALKKHKKPKYLADRVLVIFDDLVGSELFSGKRNSYFKGVNTRHRHYSTSFMMVSQGYKEIPKTIRTNWTGLVAFEIGNMKEIEVIYEEWPMGKERSD